MGTVYLAEQKEPVRRRVALKVIKLGMDTQAGAGALRGRAPGPGDDEPRQHRRVFDAGTTERGQPVLRDGARPRAARSPSTATRPSWRSPIAWNSFNSSVQACSTRTRRGSSTATSNRATCWWSTHQDGKAVPKIIDFGLARATDHQKLTEATLFTEQGQIDRDAGIHESRAGRDECVGRASTRGPTSTPWE